MLTIMLYHIHFPSTSDLSTSRHSPQEPLASQGQFSSEVGNATQLNIEQLLQQLHLKEIMLKVDILFYFLSF